MKQNTHRFSRRKRTMMGAKLLPTVEVGIPAYNEEANIETLLGSVLGQKEQSYRLVHIWVVCDGCTDKTVEIVHAVAKKDPRVVVIKRQTRNGKADALNAIYARVQSDYLFTIDADLVFEDQSGLEILVRSLEEHRNSMVAGPRHVPVEATTAMGRFAIASYLSLEDAFLQVNGGSNFYGMMSAALIRQEVVATLRYPKGTLSDQCYLYAFVGKNHPGGFRFVKASRVLFRTVSTFGDWRLLGQRSVIGDKADVAKHFGPAILTEYRLPKITLIRSQLMWFLRRPFDMAGSIAMNLFIRWFPYKKSAPTNGIWITTSSSKERIATYL